MSEQVERSVKFFKVIVAVVTSAIAILILSILQDKAEAQTFGSLINTAHADAPSDCGGVDSCDSCAPPPPPPPPGDAGGGGGTGGSCGGDDGDDGC